MIISRPISSGARRCLDPHYIFMATIQLDAATLEEDLRLGRAVFLAGLTVICCDYLLTLDLEVTHIWSVPLKRSSAWFILVRYFALIGNLALIPYFFGNFDEESCQRFSAAEDALLIVQEFFVEVTLALRVCAIYGFNRRVFGLLGIAAIVTITISVWSEVPMESNPNVDIIELSSCYVVTVKAQAIRMATAWEALLVGDIIVMGLTLWRAYTFNRTLGLATGSLLGVLVRDGVAYFGMICSVNIANIILFYTGDILMAASFAKFACAISVTMASRLILNLQEAANGDSLRATDVPLIDTQLQVAPIGRNNLGRVDSDYV
ncbi:hypothetical protein B0H16DRAFT_1578328 [Mycena metata]|uniref:DUF6533 domain-containing protein n=1 Tax=Mycena metata TaxID=1033252 RepID=A0AAD7I390_9AGAR|nr:hypothetical protein B0H16DRAFT_1578328 [Mycena metata]